MKPTSVARLLGASSAMPAAAQLLAAKGAPVAMGHYHLNASDIDAHRRFWVDLMGGSPAKLGQLECVKFPDALVFLREQRPTGGTIGSSINHIGLQMPDVPAVVAKLKHAGVPIVTKAEITRNRAKGDIFFSPSQMIYLAYVMSPDGVKIELVENRALEVPIRNHHIHFFPDDVGAMKAWHVKMFGAIPGRRGPFEECVLPGVRLTYSGTTEPVAGTKGRVLDHIGFEIKNLRAFCEKLETMGVVFDRPYQEIEALGLSIAFFTDPWGNYVELTEGLDKV